MYKKKFYKYFVFIFTLLSVFMLIIVLYCIFQMHHYKNYINNDISKLRKTEVAIIFGAGINGDKPSQYLKDRLDLGVELYKNKIVNKLLLTGDNSTKTHDEILVMKTYCQQQGVDTNAIYLDYAGFDTYSSLYRAGYIFQIDTAILISQNFHMPRALFIAKSLGIESQNLVTKSLKYAYPNFYYVREYIAFVKAAINVILHRKPKFLGEKVPISGASNFTK